LWHSPIQFIVCGLFQVTVDFGELLHFRTAYRELKEVAPAIVVQRLWYGAAPPTIQPDEDDILEQALRLEEEERVALVGDDDEPASSR
jgi:hypothetical protein